MGGLLRRRFAPAPVTRAKPSPPPQSRRPYRRSCGPRSPPSASIAVDTIHRSEASVRRGTAHTFLLHTTTTGGREHRVKVVMVPAHD
jgi:hypothetical protein